MTLALVILFAITIAQNASFTLVSRARNSGSLFYNGLASILSNGIWFIVVQKVVAKPNDVATGVTYVVAATIGSVLMQWIAIKFLEKKKAPVVQKPSVGRIVNYNDPSGKVSAALIVDVWGDDNIVDLYVFAFTGATNVVKGRRMGDKVHEWNWPKIVK